MRDLTRNTASNILFRISTIWTSCGNLNCSHSDATRRVCRKAWTFMPFTSKLGAETAGSGRNNYFCRRLKPTPALRPARADGVDQRPISTLNLGEFAVSLAFTVINFSESPPFCFCHDWFREYVVVLTISWESILTTTCSASSTFPEYNLLAYKDTSSRPKDHWHILDSGVLCLLSQTKNIMSSCQRDRYPKGDGYPKEESTPPRSSSPLSTVLECIKAGEEKPAKFLSW